MKKNLVIIPTYNEIENIESIISVVLQLKYRFHILVVDDGSPDGTADKVKELMKSSERIHILERQGKLGLGTAYIAGFRWGLQNRYDFIYEMDADFSHDPRDLERMYLTLESEVYDVVIGSRYVRGGRVENWPNNRLWLSKGASFYVKLITWMPIDDPTAGFIGYSSKVLDALDFDKIKFVGYAFQIEMKFACHSLGFRLKEIPITFKDREKGKSKMSSSIVSEAIKGVFAMKFKSLFSSYRSFSSKG